MIVYSFSTWRCYNDSPLFTVKEIEVEEKPKTYVSNNQHSRINKDSIDKLDCSMGEYKIYCLDNDPKTFVNAVIESKRKQIELIENKLQAAKNSLEKWERANKEENK